MHTPSCLFVFINCHGMIHLIRAHHGTKTVDTCGIPVMLPGRFEVGRVVHPASLPSAFCTNEDDGGMTR